MMLIFAIGAFCATLLGGLFALRLKDRLHLILGLSAGAVIGVAFFELIPEAFELSGQTGDVRTVTALIALGFVAYLILDRFISLHSHTDDDGHARQRRGIVGAGTLSFHSFLDGIGLGLAFQVSPAVGLVVALAVLAHDFSDGINTVNMILKSTGERAQAFRWLLVDALAPAAGVLATLFFTVSQTTLGYLLALFAGFFLYIGASDLLPESHHSHPVYWTTLSTILGVAVLYVVTLFA
ncbi:MAG: ZIP family metal transporter [Patescibacteria group bacterium]